MQVEQLVAAGQGSCLDVSQTVQSVSQEHKSYITGSHRCESVFCSQNGEAN